MIRIAKGALVILALLSVQAKGQNLVVADMDDLRQILSGYHDVPGADYWKRLDPDSARQALIQLSSNPSEMVHIRTRATLALANFPNGQVEQHLLSVFTREDRGYVRAAAVKAYSQVTGQASLSTLEKALSDKEDLVRLSAIRSLGNLGGEQAAQLLEKKMETEQDPVARDAFKRALSKTARP
ncbi:MAG: HEAT repeat domain-containing protein [Nitrospinota bacterium]|nr:HEAT repeat domain-containing protein [Nitrospinota bacterium]